MQRRTAKLVDVAMPDVLKESGEVERLIQPLQLKPPDERGDAMERSRARLLYTRKRFKQRKKKLSSSECEEKA